MPSDCRSITPCCSMPPTPVKTITSHLRRLADRHGTPLFIIDHDAIRRNYRHFKKHLPRVPGYYAIKANSDQEIIKTLFDEGCSFDVAAL